MFVSNLNFDIFIQITYVGLSVVLTKNDCFKDNLIHNIYRMKKGGFIVESCYL